MYIDFAEFAKKMFGKLQDLIKDSYLAMKSNLKIEVNSKELVKGKLDIINQIDNEFKDKSEKIRVRKIIFSLKANNKTKLIIPINFF